jgi:hypothetical protein
MEAVLSKPECHCSLQWAWAIGVSGDGAGMENDRRVLPQGMVWSPR